MLIPSTIQGMNACPRCTPQSPKVLWPQERTEWGWGGMTGEGGWGQGKEATKRRHKHQNIGVGLLSL